MIRYKIVLVPFPFDDLSSQKVRPAVCLTNPIGIHRHLVLAFITSRVPEHPLPTDLVLGREHPDFAETSLHIASTVQIHRLMTVTTEIIRRELGYLSLPLQNELAARINILFSA